ncbi:MAG: PAS domain S-box protein [Smithella sp.]|jgi:two-component system, NtrC family, sensor kinase
MTENDHMPECGKQEEEVIFDAIPELTFVTNADQQIIRCNKAITSRLGMSRREIEKKDAYKVFFDDQPRYANPFEEGSREIYISKLRATFLIKNNRIPDKGLMVHVLLDLSEQKQIETLYSEREAYYRTLTEMLPISVYVSQDGVFKQVNSWFTKITGYSEEYIIGCPCVSIIHPDDIEHVRQKAMAMLNGDSVVPYEYRYIDKDGNILWCVETVVSMTLNGRRAILGTQMNVTPLKEVETKLRLSEERYRTIIETIPDAYFEVDIAGNITFCNDQYLVSSGFSREEFYGLNYRQYMDSNNAALAYKVYNEVYRTGNMARHVQLEIIDKMGNPKISEHSISLIRDQEGKAVGFRGIARDITEKRQQEIQMFQSRKLESVGQLAAGIAHEINTPIQFVGDNIHFMQNAFEDILALAFLLDTPQNIDFSESQVISELIARIRQKEEEIDLEYLKMEIPKAIGQSIDGLQRVSKIVQAMREFSHPGGENMTDMDINRAIESTITLTKNEWKYTADMITSLDPDLPIAKGYTADFTQVILNIIVNAAQAIQENASRGGAQKGQIKISTRRDGNEAEICIRDTGPGIPPEVESRVFDPFFTTKAVGRGTGQGLAIAQNIIVRKHGGKIYFKTKAEEGTSFYIRLPLEGQ